jgi:hypothetical protein
MANNRRFVSWLKVKKCHMATEAALCPIGILRGFAPSHTH